MTLHRVCESSSYAFFLDDESWRRFVCFLLKIFLIMIATGYLLLELVVYLEAELLDFGWTDTLDVSSACLRAISPLRELT